jgi:3-dehydro-4-phosphotetronate decarboxylase
MREEELRREVVRLAKSLFDRGLSPGASGNISVRLDEDLFIVTPTNACLGFLEPDRLSLINKEGQWLAGDKPSKEIPLHLALYKTRPDAGAVVHLHSTYAVAYSLISGLAPDDALPPLTPYVVMRLGNTALLPYRRPGDQEIGDAIEALGGRYVSLLLANHGPVVAAPTLEQAVYGFEELEQACKLHFILRGSAFQGLDHQQIAELISVFGDRNSA